MADELDVLLRFDSSFDGQRQALLALADIIERYREKIGPSVAHGKKIGAGHDFAASVTDRLLKRHAAQMRERAAKLESAEESHWNFVKLWD